ncbi:sigma-70 family RNA polymerase sigma factor [Pseudonocardia parietis]|uniref:RNA polymerase sigma-B factor n=1 Tax=Pseudonocardia parietis TaxID=570936 RepID=A0ABS4VVE5_9PSEU|nr:sigma-70 family RNA polymerase sigma factor [Pseudonocardia parietis]MBP2367912.1 RNA polymerase sigma-B factor [Pseudonocardia parietis]
MRTQTRMPAQRTQPTRRDGPHGYDDLEPDLRRLAAMQPHDPGRGPLRDRLICEFLPLVRNLSRRYLTATHSAEDIQQAATLGLIKALDRYNPDAATGGPLGYLIPSVRGEILRYLRDHSWALRVPRDLKELGVGINRATITLTQRLGRAPRPSELAEELDTTTADVVEALGALESYRAASLDIPGPDGELTLGERLGADDPDLEAATMRDELRERIDALPPRERRILLLRFFGDRTQSEIAAEIGVSQMHVSRLLSRVVTRLREELGG